MTDEMEKQDPLVEKLSQQLEGAESNPFVDYLSLKRSTTILLPILGEMVDEGGCTFLRDLAIRIQPALGYSTLKTGEIGKLIDEEGEKYNLRKETLRGAVQRFYPGDDHRVTTTGKKSHNRVVVYRELADLEKYIKGHTTSVNTKTVTEVNLDL